LVIRYVPDHQRDGWANAICERIIGTLRRELLDLYRFRTWCMACPNYANFPAPKSRMASGNRLAKRCGRRNPAGLYLVHGDAVEDFRDTV
jgi:hypothetical protein